MTFTNFRLLIHVYVGVFVYMCGDAYRGWKKALNLLELESQAVLESPSLGARD